MATYGTESEEEIFAELNAARTEPLKYVKHLQFQVQFYNGTKLKRPDETTVVTVEGAIAVQEAIEFLKRQDPLPPFKRISDGLSKGARDHCGDSGPRGGVGHKGTDGSDSFQRMNRYGKWKGKAGENICYGGEKPQDVVLQWIIDDGAKNRPHRMSIFDPSFAVVGIASGPHSKYKKMTVVSFAKDYLEGKEHADPPSSTSANTNEGNASKGTDDNIDLQSSEDNTCFVISEDLSGISVENMKLMKRSSGLVLTYNKRDGDAIKTITRQWQLPFVFHSSSVRANFNGNGKLSMYVRKPGKTIDTAKTPAEICKFSIPADPSSSSMKVTLDIDQTDLFFLVRTVPTKFYEDVVVELKGEVLALKCTHTEEQKKGNNVKKIIKEFTRSLKLPYAVSPSDFTVVKTKTGVEMKIAKPDALGISGDADEPNEVEIAIDSI